MTDRIEAIPTIFSHLQGHSYCYWLWPA